MSNTANQLRQMCTDVVATRTQLSWLVKPSMAFNSPESVTIDPPFEVALNRELRRSAEGESRFVGMTTSLLISML